MKEKERKLERETKRERHTQNVSANNLFCGKIVTRYKLHNDPKGSRLNLA